MGSDEFDALASEPLRTSILLAKPYNAALHGDWNAVKDFYEQHEELISEPLTIFNDTVLHFAVHGAPEELFVQLLEKVVPEKLKEKNGYGNTVLSEVAMTDKVELAEAVLKKCGESDLIELPNNKGEIPLFIAAAYGNANMVKLLASKVGGNIQHHLQRKYDNTSILHVAISGNCFEAALEMIKLPGFNPQWTDEQDQTCLQLLANMPSAFRSGARLGIFRGIIYFCLPDQVWQKHHCDVSWETVSRDVEAGENLRVEHELIPNQVIPTVSSKINIKIWECLSKVYPAIQKVWDSKKKHEWALLLVKILLKTDKSWMNRPTRHGIDQEIQGMSSKDGEEVEKQDDEPKKEDDLKTANDIPLLAAAKNGIIEMVKATLEEYPQAIEYVNEKNANALHVAVRNRRQEIFEYLLSFDMQLPRLIQRLDFHGNSLLHQVAVTEACHKSYHARPGEALHMQWEIQWFERVNNILPNQYANLRNNHNLTGQEWFTISHTELASEGQEWLRRTAESCSVVAALIATVAFTSAYTIPGGNDKRSGMPIFLDKQPFLVFTTSDALSLTFSLTSLVIFLSIITAPFHHREFHLSLPLRLVFGLTSLFLSVACMMAAFVATLVLMYQQYIHLAVIPIYFLACYPVTFFFYLLQFPLYVRLTWLTVNDLVKAMTNKFCPRLGPALLWLRSGGSCMNSAIF